MGYHLSEDAHGRSWTLILVRTLMDVGWTLGGRWVDAQPTFKDAGKNWSRDGNATVTVTLPNNKKHCSDK